jgi:hypothetical protein
MAQISGKIKEWQDNLNGNLNVILAGDKSAMVLQDKAWLKEKYPAGSSVTVFHQNGVLTSMRGIAEEKTPSSPAAPPQSSTPAKAISTADAETDIPPMLGLFDGFGNGQIRVIPDGETKTVKFYADLDLLKLLSSPKTPVRPGQRVAVRYVKTKDGNVATAMGADGPAPETPAKLIVNSGVNTGAGLDEKAAASGFTTGAKLIQQEKERAAATQPGPAPQETATTAPPARDPVENAQTPEAKKEAPPISDNALSAHEKIAASCIRDLTDCDPRAIAALAAKEPELFAAFEAKMRGKSPIMPASKKAPVPSSTSAPTEFSDLDFDLSPAELAQLAVDDPPKFHRLDTFRRARMASQKAMFIEILQGTGREGIPAILEWLEKETDFYTAPSSTKFHEAREGGLLHHSLKVFEHINELSPMFEGDWPPAESMAIIALLHDVCKTNHYRLEIKALPRRDDKGKLVMFDGRKIWDETPMYSVEDEVPLGHGEKSVIQLLQHGIKLTDEEIMAIRWHMMSFDDLRYSFVGNQTITKASGEHPLVVLLHLADLSASYLNIG